MTAFRGVQPATPFDTAPSTRVTTTVGTTVAVPGVTTTTAGALLVGGVGVNNATVPVAAPTGWTEKWESTGAQVAEQAFRAQPTAGATGTATWTLASSYTAGGWLVALRPAAGG